MCLGTVSAYPKTQIWGEIQNRKIPVFWPSLAPSDLIWVTLGQDTYCMTAGYASDLAGPQKIAAWPIGPALAKD